MDETREEVHAGSGSVFADLGFEEPEEELAKADLVIAIGRALRERKLRQRQAAALLGLPQSKISGLLRGDTDGYSSDRLMRLLTRLQYAVEIVLKPSSRPVGRVQVLAPR